MELLTKYLFHKVPQNTPILAVYIKVNVSTIYLVRTNFSKAIFNFGIWVVKITILAESRRSKLK